MESMRPSSNVERVQLRYFVDNHDHVRVIVINSIFASDYLVNANDGAKRDKRGGGGLGGIGRQRSNH